jgi:hypothetical protein
MTGVSAMMASYGKMDPIANLVLDLDAANYSAVPTNGSTIAGGGGYTITVANPGALISWNSANNGVFRVASAASNSTNFLTFGPDYSSTTQAYTVMMVYRSLSGTAGRLLNANTANPDWLMGLWGSGAGVQDIFFNGSFVGSSSTAQDGSWRFGWFTFNGGTPSNTTNAYVAGNTAPTTTYGTKTGNGGFNGLRLFGRYNSSTTIVEQVTADVGLVKVWDGALKLSQVQAEHAAYKTRFGY